MFKKKSRSDAYRSADNGLQAITEDLFTVSEGAEQAQQQAAELGQVTDDRRSPSPSPRPSLSSPRVSASPRERASPRPGQGSSREAGSRNAGRRCVRARGACGGRRGLKPAGWTRACQLALIVVACPAVVLRTRRPRYDDGPLVGKLRPAARPQQTRTHELFRYVGGAKAQGGRGGAGDGCAFAHSIWWGRVVVPLSPPAATTRGTGRATARCGRIRSQHRS